MSLSERYDMIATGFGIAPYLCGALHAHAGKKVLVVDEEDAPLPGSPLASHLSQNFDPSFMSFSGGHENSPFVQSLTELGLTSSVNTFEPLKVLTQVLTPDFRVSFFANSENTTKELLRELGSSHLEKQIISFFEILYKASHETDWFIDAVLTQGQCVSTDIASLKRFWAQFFPYLFAFPPENFSEVFRRSATASSSQSVLEALETIINAMMANFSYSNPGKLCFEQVARSLGLFLRGRYHFPGGMIQLKDKLAEIIKMKNGHIKNNAKVESLVVEKKKITGVLLSTFEGICNADYVALGSRIKKLYKTLPLEVQDNSVLRSLNRLVFSHWSYTILLTVNKDVLPLGATENMTYVGSGQLPLEEENYLKIQVLPSEHSKAKESDRELSLFVTALVPYKASCMNHGYLRKLSGKMLQSLSKVIPFLEKNIIRVSPDFRYGEEELKKAFQFKAEQWVPENLLQYYVQGHRGVQEFWGSPWSTPHGNLYFIGRSIWPSLGFYGEALSAHKVFLDLQHR